MFSDIQPKPVGQWSQSSRRGSQNWIQHKQRIMARENLLFPRRYTVFYQIPTLSEKLPPFLQGTFFGFVKKLHSHWQKKQSPFKLLRKKWLFNPYQTSAVMNSAFRGNCADGLNQIAFTVTIGTLLGIKTSHQVLFPSSFSDSARTFFGRLLKIFRRVCPSAFIPPVHSNNLWKKLPKKTVLLLSFLEVEQTFSACCRSFFSCCRNCILRVPRNVSGKILLFWRN